MGKLTIYREESAAFTAVSNTFIDNYMADANDAQLKVYLYLLRAFQANQDTSISDMADLFNHTEKDIVRALKYWEKKSLLALDYDTSKNVSAIHLLTSAPVSAGVLPEKAEVSAAPPEPSVPIQTPLSDPIPEKPSYSLDDLKAFRSNEETEQLLFIVEQYIGKPLSASEVRTVLFIYDKLGFSTDLIDYLVQYCVGKEKKSFRYIEKVAVEWAEHHISTPEQAKAFACKYDKNVYTIMKALGDRKRHWVKAQIRRQRKPPILPVGPENGGFPFPLSKSPASEPSLLWTGIVLNMQTPYWRAGLSPMYIRSKTYRQ